MISVCLIWKVHCWSFFREWMFERTKKSLWKVLENVPQKSLKSPWKRHVMICGNHETAKHQIWHWSATFCFCWRHMRCTKHWYVWYLKSILFQCKSFLFLYTCSCTSIWRGVIPSQQHWRGYSNAAVRVWLGEWVSWCVSRAFPCGHDIDYSFCPITFKPHM